MYSNKKNRSNYEGPFAWKPDRIEHGIWGTREIHDRTFGPPVRLQRDWYGRVTKLERSWFDW